MAVAATAALGIHASQTRAAAPHPTDAAAGEGGRGFETHRAGRDHWGPHSARGTTWIESVVRRG